MKYFTYSFYFLFLSVALFSCDDFRAAEGTVVDASSGEPLDSVLIEVMSGWHAGYTDSTGYFSVRNPSEICMNGCSDLKVKFSKEGYKTLILKNAACSGKIEIKQ